MKPEETGKAYNSITHLWTREGFDQSNGIQQHDRAISFVQNRGSALDVGCGCTGRFINLLIEHELFPEGVDVSSEMVKLAKQKHAEINFHHADICTWELSKKYDFITAWDSIWHIPLDQQESTMKKLFAALTEGGYVFFLLVRWMSPATITMIIWGR